MIIKGKSRAGPAALAHHLANAETNERVELIETKGTVAGDLHGALLEMDSFALGTRSEKSLYHASISPEPPHLLTPEQRLEAVEVLEEKLGLTGHARVVVLHEKEGREHLHIVWSRIDLNSMTAVSDSHNYRKHEEVARDLERRFGHGRIKGAHAERGGTRRPPRTPSRAELRQEERTGVGIRRVRADVTKAFRSSDSPDEFRRALWNEGYVLAHGDRRDFVVIDHAGGIHSLARRIDGVTTAELRKFMAGLNPADLPSITEARAIMSKRKRGSVTMDLNISHHEASSWMSYRGPASTTGKSSLSRLFGRSAARVTNVKGSYWRTPFRYVGRSIVRPARPKIPFETRRRKWIEEMKAAWRACLPRRRPHRTSAENEITKPTARRPREMTFHELIAWHRANGTLTMFLRSMGIDPH